MKNILRKNAKFIIILAIIALGAFLRFYNFADWLHFELDQSRDAKVIDLAVENGPGALPLLGPKAAGSFLRLGPIFYYFKYLSALVFGNTPSGIATIIMIFGILAVPAFYLLIRRYFSKWISISLLLLFSTSLFLIMYSRFSWNPNPLPLFTILTIYSLLRAVDRDERGKGRWLLLASFFLAVVTQLHFLAFVSMPVIASAFLVFKRPRIKLAYWIGSFGIILFLNLPVILNEIKTGGENFYQFKEVAMGKTDKDNERGIIAKLVRDYNEHAANYFLILSGQNTEFVKLEQNIKNNLGCDQECKKNLPLEVLALAILSLGLILMLKKIFFERDPEKKNFLVIVLIWFLVSFGLFIPLAFDISPRFWLIASALPFVFLGFVFDFLKKIFPRKFSIFLIFLIIFTLTVSNGYKVYQRFKGLSEAHQKTVEVSADRILREKHRVTLFQQYLVIDYIESFYKKNGYPVYLNSEPFYRRSLMFHLDQKKIPREDFRNANNSGKVYKNGNYFLVYPTDSNLDKELNDYATSYNLANKKIFGTLTVIQLIPKLEAVNAVQQEIQPKNSVNVNSAGVPERYTWEEIFSSTEEED